MPVYQRITMVNAIQFDEKEYAANPLLYPDVWDRGMLSELWWNKTAIDGRYYLTNQPNTLGGTTEYVTVNNGDYIIREELGTIYTIPKEVFENNFKKISD